MFVHAFSSQRAWQTDGVIILPALFVTKTGRRLMLYWTLGRPQENGPYQNNTTTTNNTQTKQKQQKTQTTTTTPPPPPTTSTTKRNRCGRRVRFCNHHELAWLLMAVWSCFLLACRICFVTQTVPIAPLSPHKKYLLPSHSPPEGKCFNRTWFFASGVLHSESGGG